ncbi:MAG: hypothetical protein ACO3CC_05020 [Alphaproteobacteria bacterium]
MATRLSSLMMPASGVPVAGDLLRLAFHASRFHPDGELRASIGEAIDLMLDAGGARAFPAREAAEALAAAEGSALAPMLCAAEDALLAARFWRLAELEPAMHRPDGDSQVFVGSADAVGSGHGAVLGRAGAAAYPSRAARAAAAGDLHWVNLGIARKPRDGGLPRKGDAGTLKVERDGGVTLRCRLASLPGDAPAFDQVLLGFHPHGRPIEYRELGARDFAVELGRDQRLSLRPASPEASIRLASACADRPRLLLCSSVKPEASTQRGRSRIRGSFDLILQLAPLDEAPCPLPCVRVSHVGTLAEWMSLPATLAALDLAPGQRAAIAAHYATT